MKVFLRFALCIQNCPSFPFHLISISVPELTKYKTGGRPGHLAVRDFIIHCSPLSIILYSETYAEQTVQHFHHIKKPPSLNSASMPTREWLYMLCSRKVWERITEIRGHLGSKP